MKIKQKKGRQSVKRLDNYFGIMWFSNINANFLYLYIGFYSINMLIKTRYLKINI